MEIQPVTPDRWDDLVELFTRRGPRGGTPITANCWCMFWRRRTGDAAKNRQNMRQIVRAGREPGVLAYDEGTPVGWASVGPREEFHHVMRSRNYGPVEEELGVFSIVCFYVDPRAKKRGVGGALLDAAVEHALRRGARAVEAYPHERGDYMGSVEAFERRGFRVIRDVPPRKIVRYSR